MFVKSAFYCYLFLCIIDNKDPIKTYGTIGHNDQALKQLTMQKMAKTQWVRDIGAINPVISVSVGCLFG